MGIARKEISNTQDLRAAVRKYRLWACKMKKSQNIALGEQFLEKKLLVRLDFSFTRAATESVRKLSRHFSWANDHILLKNRLQIKEETNSASGNRNRKSST